jgi:hypothetical protein
VGSGLQLYKTHYLGQGGTTTTWDGDYAKPLGKLPTQAKLSAELLETLVRATRVNSRSRQRAAMAAGALAKFAGLNWSATHLTGQLQPCQGSPQIYPQMRRSPLFATA